MAELTRQIIEGVSVTFAVILFCCRAALAAELKVVDESGMVRSVKEISGPTTITLSLADSDGSTVQVVRVDGLADTRVKTVERGEATFANMVAGTWKILHNPRKVRAVRVSQ